MTVTARGLARHPHLGLELIAGRHNADRPIGWAHAIELVDPTPYLSGGELVMTTGMSLGRTANEQRDYLKRLSEVGVTALAFDTGTTFAHVPAGIVAAGDALGMPILAVPAHTPFIAITRAVIDEVTADQLRSIQRVADRQEAMARETLKDGIPAVASALGASLSATVIVLAPDGSRVAAYGHHSERLYQLCRQQLQEAKARTNQASRVIIDGDAYCSLQIIRAARTHRGYLAVRSVDPLSPLDRLLVSHAVSLIAIEMDKPAKVLEIEHRLRAVVTNALLTTATPVDAGLLQYFGFAPEEPATVIVLTNTGPALAAERHTQRILEALITPYLLCSRTDYVYLVFPTEAATIAANEVLHALGTQLQRRIRGGCSLPGSLDNLVPCLNQALAATRTKLAEIRVLDFAELNVFSVILDNRSKVELELLSQRLKPLDEHDSTQITLGVSMVTVLEAYLRENGHVESAATTLGIHRHTMRKRLEKIRDLIHCDLQTADSRAEMWLAIKARELLAIGAPNAGLCDR